MDNVQKEMLVLDIVLDWRYIGGVRVYRERSVVESNGQCGALCHTTSLHSPSFHSLCCIDLYDFSRLLVYIKEDFVSPVRVKYVTKLFVFGDVVSFLLVAAGAGLQASADTLEKSKNGSNIVVGGLAVQLIFFSSFLFLSILCHVRLNRHSWRKTFPGKLQWPALFYALYSSCILILARSFYRVVEYSQGREGELMTTEIYMYMLDTLLMFLVMVTFSIVHPTYVIYKPDTVESYRLSDEEMK